MPGVRCLWYGVELVPTPEAIHLVLAAAPPPPSAAAEAPAAEGLASEIIEPVIAPTASAGRWTAPPPEATAAGSNLRAGYRAKIVDR